MLKNKLTPYILVSVLIHTGFLFGTHSFLRLPDAELDPPVLIPVEVVVLGKQPPDPALKITASELMATKKQGAIARSPLAADMADDQISNELADPIPAEVNYQPSVNLETKDPIHVIQMASARQRPAGQPELALSQTPPLDLASAYDQIYELPPVAKADDSAPRLADGTMSTPTQSAASKTPKGDEVASKPVVVAIQMTTIRLVPAEPSMPAGFSPTGIRTSADLVAAGTAASPHYFQKGNQAASEPVNLAVQTPPVHLAAVEPSSPAGSTPLEISTSGDLIEAKTAAIPHISQNGKEVASKAVDLAEQKPSEHLSMVEPSPVAGSTPADISTSTDLAEAAAAASPHFSQASHKAVTSLAATQTLDDLVSELRPPPKQVESQPHLMASTLQINSYPNGAQVYVDGMMSGETPLDMELTLGKHEVRLSLPDHYDLEAQVELTETNESIPIYFPLLPVD